MGSLDHGENARCDVVGRGYLPQHGSGGLGAAHRFVGLAQALLESIAFDEAGCHGVDTDFGAECAGQRKR